MLSIDSERLELRTAVHKGEFWKPCPGTSDDYLCCGYQILTPLTGCGMYCGYCILQVYFNNHHQTVFENFGDLEAEVHRKMEKHTCGAVRFGTGEFGDSLYQENRLGLSKKIAAVLDRYHNVLVEFKTKSVNISTLGQIKNPRKVVIGFSLNTERVVELLENGTAPIKKRLEAAARCEEMGFSVAFHFDPMVWYDGWEQEYRQVVTMIYDYIKDPRSIAWCSMGGFRTMPSLKGELRESLMYLPLFAGEMILGADGKLRYPRPLRVEFYKAMDEQFRKHHTDAPLYLCMESREVWEECGMYERIPNGLTRFLDERALTILKKRLNQDFQDSDNG
ncbi:MAG: radical SAM protein [Chitinispirillales bacterium]|jgi:spore photoproduct lyase|nr:radical SAM protein [Chitinispirillales bacterium]